MNTAVEEVAKLCGKLPDAVEQENSNRYRLLVEEKDKTHTVRYRINRARRKENG